MFADLVDRFRTLATDRAGAIAVIDGANEYSYEELDSWSNRVAGTLRHIGVRQGDRVALRLPASAEAIVGILGVLKAGGAYVPLDMRNPPARNEYVLGDCEASVLIGDPGGAGVGHRPVLSADAIAALRTTGDPLPNPAGGDLAYVIYTSGTTGVPKGVPIRHKNVEVLLDALVGVFAPSHEDRWLLSASLGFDMSVLEIWGALGSGATLVIAPPARHPSQIAKILADRQITVLTETPTRFGQLSSVVIQRDIDLSAVRVALIGGEKVLPATLQPWVDRYGLDRPMLINMYGPTEATVLTMTHRFTPGDLIGDESVIGKAMTGSWTGVVIDGRYAEPGELGELWLSGGQLSSGYIGLDELTDERFPVVDLGDGPRRYYRTGDLARLREDGRIVYHGRADLQVKVRGHRIELSDIESALQAHPSIAEAIVVVIETRPGEPHLMCAVVTQDGAEPDSAALREHISSALPNYMWPVRYIGLPNIPLTVSGKVDRDAVAKAFSLTAIDD